MAIITEITEDDQTTVALLQTCRREDEKTSFVKYFIGVIAAVFRRTHSSSLETKRFKQDEKAQWDAFIVLFHEIMWAALALLFGVMFYMCADEAAKVTVILHSVKPGVRFFDAIVGCVVAFMITQLTAFATNSKDWGPYIAIVSILVGMCTIQCCVFQICHLNFSVIESILSTIAIGALLYFVFPTKEE